MGHARDLAATVRGSGHRDVRRGAISRQFDGQGSPIRSGWKRGAAAQAIGRSRGGRTTKIHAVVDAAGRPIALEVTPGQVGDIRMAQALVISLPAASALAADTAYDSDRFRSFLIERGTTPVIPNNPTRKRLHPFDERRYAARNLIERMFCRLKDWRRIATRYDKRAITFISGIFLAAALTWWT